MKTIVRLLSILALATFAGCASLQPGADPIIVRAQQTERVAFETFDTFLRLEHKHAARIRSAAPAVSKFAEWLREPQPDGPRGIALVRSLGNVRRAYAAAKTPDNKARLSTALDALSAALAETQKHLTAAKAL